MEGVGALLLVFAGWLGYCALHSYRPIQMGKAILADPKDAAQTLANADAEAASTGASSNNGGATGGGSSGGGGGGGGGGAWGSVDITGNGSSNVKDEQAYANQLGAAMWGGAWNASEMNDLVMLWNRESGWNPKAYNASSGATGIPQSLPGNKMASAGSDWKTNPDTQIKWGLGYIKDRYGSPSAAWAHETEYGWY